MMILCSLEQHLGREKWEISIHIRSPPISSFNNLYKNSPREKSYVPLVAAQTTSSSSCPLEASSALCPDALQVPLRPQNWRTPPWKADSSCCTYFFSFFFFLTGIILENGTAQTHLALMQVVSKSASPPLALLL